jgi:hypothetical protein
VGAPVVDFNLTDGFFIQASCKVCAAGQFAFKGHPSSHDLSGTGIGAAVGAGADAGADVRHILLTPSQQHLH